MSSLEFEEMDSSGQFAHLMDDSAEKMAWNRSAAVDLLAMADAYEERAEKLRHLAATLILDAQAFAEDIGTFLAMEFPMTGGEEEEEEADE
jgi:hypothetical protein